MLQVHSTTITSSILRGIYGKTKPPDCKEDDWQVGGQSSRRCELDLLDFLPFPFPLPAFHCGAVRGVPGAAIPCHGHVGPNKGSDYDLKKKKDQIGASLSSVDSGLVYAHFFIPIPGPRTATVAPWRPEVGNKKEDFDLHFHFQSSTILISHEPICKYSRRSPSCQAGYAQNKEKSCQVGLHYYLHKHVGLCHSSAQIPLINYCFFKKTYSLRPIKYKTF